MEQTQKSGGGMSVRKLTTLAMLAAVSIALVYLIRVPMFLPFLEYDPADIPILIATFLFGPGTGLLLTVVVSVVQGLTVSATSGPIGIAMHIVATGCYVLVAGNIYRQKTDRTGAVVALVAGTLAQTAAMLLWNVILTPIYMNVPREMVISLLVPAFLPFNLIKAGGNSVVTFFLYKSISNVLKRMSVDK